MSENIVTNDNFDFEKAFNESFKSYQENTIIKAKVLNISDDIVFLDFGYKAEAKLPTAEFEKMPEIGEEVEVFLERLEGRNGEPIVSKKRIDSIKARKELKRIWKERGFVKGTIKDNNRNGFIVDYNGINGFIPFYLFDKEKVEKPENYKNKEVYFYVDKINFRDEISFSKESKDEFVGNRKKYIYEENNILKKKFFEEKKEGDIVKGVVKKIIDFGAFIDVGGVDALLKIKDVSWIRISKIEDVLKEGQEIEVQILSINNETRKIAVGLKQLLEDPWLKFINEKQINDVIVGTVSSITTYGAFVKIYEGIEGLLHISDMSWVKKINNPSELLKAGQNVELMITNIDKKNRKVSLSLKHLLDNPWDDVKNKYNVGKKIKGKIKSITTFGFFVELEEGIDALLHIDDISWTDKIKNPHSLYNVGDEIEAVVIQCEPEKNKIKIGVKQLTKDPWEDLKEKFKNGDIIECEVEKIDFEKGLTVKITDQISSFIPIVHLGLGKKQELKDSLRTHYKVGDKINALITNMDIYKRKIIVSVKEYLRKEERDKVEDFLHNSLEDNKYTLGDIMKNKLDNNNK